MVPLLLLFLASLSLRRATSAILADGRIVGSDLESMLIQARSETKRHIDLNQTLMHRMWSDLLGLLAEPLSSEAYPEALIQSHEHVRNLGSGIWLAYIRTPTLDHFYNLHAVIINALQISRRLRKSFVSIGIGGIFSKDSSDWLIVETFYEEEKMLGRRVGTFHPEHRNVYPNEGLIAS